MNDNNIDINSLIQQYSLSIQEIFEIRNNPNNKDIVNKMINHLLENIICDLEISNKETPLEIINDPYYDIQNKINLINKQINESFFSIIEKQRDLSINDMNKCYCFGIITAFIYIIPLIDNYKSNLNNLFDIALVIDKPSAFLLLSLYERGDNSMNFENIEIANNLKKLQLCYIEDNQRILLTKEGIDLIERHRDILIYIAQEFNMIQKRSHIDMLNNQYY